MFRDDKPSFSLPIDACLHPVLSLFEAKSKDDFLTGREKKFAFDLPHQLLPAPCSMAWSEDGLYVAITLSSPPPYTPQWPKYKSGDAVELFIDTRNRRSFRLMHRFCHQFVLFPEAIDGVTSREVTQFRTQEVRPLVEVNRVHVEVLQAKRVRQSSVLFAFIPRDVLYGWDTDDMANIGFGYTCYSKGSSSVLSFPLSSERGMQLERFPHRWATCTLVR